MVKKVKNVLGIDWGKKYIGLAYLVDGTSLVMPIGFILNESSMFFDIGEILKRYNINKIIVGYPQKQEDIKEHIDEFITSLTQFVPVDTEIDRFDEDYTSVQAGATTGNFNKNAATDTLAAMHILEQWAKLNK